MARKILVCGATGNQGGSVAKLLLQHPDQYSVRALTRNSDSSTARDLKALGAEIVSGDLNVYSYVQTAMKGCWGVFGVTNFYDPKIKGSPHSEEQQGRYLAQAALEADVQCFVWSTLPSSKGMSGGRTVSMIYEGKHAVDGYIKEIGLPACFLLTGNFYENMTLRGHVTYNKETDELEFRQPIIREDAKLAMLYVERDLSGIAKAVFDQWDTKKEALRHKYLYASDARISPSDIVESLKRISGKNATYTVLQSTGVPDRDIMFQLYNDQGMYGTQEIPDPNVLALGVQLHGLDDFVTERLLPHLGL